MANRTTIKNLILTAFVISSGFSMSSFAHDRYHDQDWRPAPVYQQKIRAYDYVYYPAQQTYFSPSTNNWFWLGGNGWQVSTRLPSHLNLDLRFGGIPVSLGSEQPYFEHAFVERSYGRPWRETHVSRSYYEAPRYTAWRYEQAPDRRYEPRYEPRYERRDDRSYNREYVRDEWRNGEHRHGHHRDHDEDH